MVDYLFQQYGLLYWGFWIIKHFVQLQMYTIAAAIYSSVAASPRRYDVTAYTFAPLWDGMCVFGGESLHL